MIQFSHDKIGNQAHGPRCQELAALIAQGILRLQRTRREVPISPPLTPAESGHKDLEVSAPSRPHVTPG